MPSPKVFLITGANRGIGLEYVKQIVAGDSEARVIAAARNPDEAEELQALVKANEGRVATLKLDLNDLEGFQAAAVEAATLPIAAQGIDVLLSNAGINAGETAGPLDPKALEYLAENIKVNLLGTAATVQAFLPLLRQRASKRVWIVSTQAGAFVNGWSDKEIIAAYSVSKAALNMWTVKLARALDSEGFTVIAFSPGWVSTSMGGPDAPVKVEDSVEQGLATLLARTPADSGKFFSFEGGEIAY